ncbi:Agmatine deiminase, partial [Pseudolycoriella hygida]
RNVALQLEYPAKHNTLIERFVKTYSSKMSSSTYEPYVPENGIRMIAEWERHDRVFMGWPTSAVTWLEDANQGIYEDILQDVAEMANSIVEFEPVVMFADPGQIRSAEKMLDPRITIIPMEFDDLWARDMLPVFVEKVDKDGNKTLAGIDFNFNGYGNKTEHDKSQFASAKLLEMFKIERIPAYITNNHSKEEIEEELRRVLGIRKFIWLEGVAGKDYTDGHVDCLFGDEESDLEAVRVVSSAFPGRKVISTGLSALACLGGGVHCFTKEQPLYHRN